MLCLCIKLGFRGEASLFKKSKFLHPTPLLNCCCWSCTQSKESPKYGCIHDVVPRKIVARSLREQSLWDALDGWGMPLMDSPMGTPAPPQALAPSLGSAAHLKSRSTSAGCDFSWAAASNPGGSLIINQPSPNHYNTVNQPWNKGPLWWHDKISSVLDHWGFFSRPIDPMGPRGKRPTWEYLPTNTLKLYY